MAWQTRSSPANDAQQQETHTLLDTANGISSDTQKAFDEACYPAVAPAEAQQQQLRGVNQQIGYAQSAANGITDQVSDGHQDAPLRHCRHLISFIWSNGHVCMLLAAFIFSLSVLCVKLTGNRVPVLQITLARSFISFIISMVLIKARSIRPMFGQRKHSMWLVGRGVSGALAMMTFYVAILKLPLADANTLFFLNPCMTAVAAWLFLGEPLGLLGACGCVLSLLGLVLLTHPPMLFGGHADWGPQRVWGTVFGVASAVGATGAFICIRFVGKAEPAIVVALYFHTSTMILSFIPLAIGFPQPAAWVSPKDTLLLLGVAATSFFGQLSLTRGFQLLNASKAAGLNFSQVLWGYIFGILLFGEELTLFGVLGTLLIAVGMICVTARSKSSAADQKQSVDVKPSANSLVLPTRQQQQQGGDSSSSSRSLLSQLLSFRWLPKGGRHHYQPAAAAEADDGSDNSACDIMHLGQSTVAVAAAAAAAASHADVCDQYSRDDGTVLDVQQQQQQQQQHTAVHSKYRDMNWNPTSGVSSHNQQWPAAAAAATKGFGQPGSAAVGTSAAGDAELVPLGHIQHRHAGVHQQQQQGWQQQYDHNRSPADLIDAVSANDHQHNQGNTAFVQTSSQQAVLGGRAGGNSIGKYDSSSVELSNVELVSNSGVLGSQVHDGDLHVGQDSDYHDAFVEIPLGRVQLVQHQALQPLWSVSSNER